MAEVDYFRQRKQGSIKYENYYDYFPKLIDTYPEYAKSKDFELTLVALVRKVLDAFKMEVGLFNALVKNYKRNGVPDDEGNLVRNLSEKAINQIASVKSFKCYEGFYLTKFHNAEELYTDEHRRNNISKEDFERAFRDTFSGQITTADWNTGMPYKDYILAYWFCRYINTTVFFVQNPDVIVQMRELDAVYKAEMDNLATRTSIVNKRAAAKGIAVSLSAVGAVGGLYIPAATVGGAALVTVGTGTAVEGVSLATEKAITGECNVGAGNVANALGTNLGTFAQLLSRDDDSRMNILADRLTFPKLYAEGRKILEERSKQSILDQNIFREHYQWNTILGGRYMVDAVYGLIELVCKRNHIPFT